MPARVPSAAVPPSPAAPPDWTLVDVRERAAAWVEDHRFTRAALAVAVFAVVALVSWPAAGGGPGDGGSAATLISLLIGGTLGGALGIAGGHIVTAGHRYPRHVTHLHRLLASVTRTIGPVEAAAAAVLAVVLGLVAPPLVGLTVGVTLGLIVPTGPGVALASALDRAADAIADEAGASPRGPRSLASLLLLAGIGTVFLALLRTLWASAPTCGLAWVGVSCGSDTAMLLAVGAIPAAWWAAPIGAVVSESLDLALDLAPGAASRTSAPAAQDLDLDEERIDELVELVHARFEQLSPDTRQRTVELVASTLDGEASVEGGEDVLARLETAIRNAGPSRTVAAVGTLHEHAGTIGKLRSQYDRTPRLARSAIERTATTAVRTAGVPRAVAGDAVETLLTMPDDDWQTVSATLDEVVDRFGPRSD